MKHHSIMAIDDTGAYTERLVAQAFGAGLDGVRTVMNAPLETGDGRSEWMWLLLQNGDLVLGVFPQGDTYCEIEGLVERDYKVATEGT